MHIPQHQLHQVHTAAQLLFLHMNGALTMDLLSDRPATIPQKVFRDWLAFAEKAEESLREILELSAEDEG